MIRCKLVEYFNPDATQTGARVDRAVSGESLSVGRAASCKIYLPDPRVRLEHASIVRAEDGYLHLEAAGPVFVNERPRTNARLSVGQTITIGPYDFVVEGLDDGPQQQHPQLTLTFALRASTTSQGTQFDLQPGSGLRRSWINTRRLAWLLSLAVLLLGAVFPVWNAFDAEPRNASPASMRAATQPPGLPPAGQDLRMLALSWVRTNTARLDTFWNPGQISSAHQTFAQDCRSCHTQPFERVGDAACTSCHKNTGVHVPDKVLDLETFRGQRCATCHKEHQGLPAMRTVDAISCESCHGDIKRHAPQAALGNISDFDRNHPAFRLASMVAENRNVAAPHRADAAGPQGDSGLRFPHALHLAKAGIKSPLGPVATGGRVHLECGNCHTLDAASVRYQPVRMDLNCQTCHRLSVDPQAPERQVPHAKPQVVVTAVREIYASLAVDRVPVSLVTVNSLLLRPGGQAAPPVTTSAGRWVQERSQSALSGMFESRNGVCKTCHDIQKSAGAAPAASRWVVTPVVMTQHWLPKSAFSHLQHKEAQCSACHQADTSRQASDILIPDIATCRTCHTGAQAQQDKVVSRCDSCHGFHAKTEHPAFRRKLASGPSTP